MVNIQMVPMKKGNVSLACQYLKKNRFRNGRTFLKKKNFMAPFYGGVQLPQG